MSDKGVDPNNCQSHGETDQGFGSDLQETHHHPGSANHESIPATTLLHNIEAGECAGAVDGSENELGDIAVAQTSRGKDGGAKVLYLSTSLYESRGRGGTHEEEVDTSKLLTSLKSNSECGTVQHTGSSKDLVPSRLGQSALFVKLLLDFGDLAVDAGSIRRKTSQSGNGVSSFVLTTLAVGISRTLGKEKNTGAKDQRPQEGKAVGDPPRCGGSVALSAPVDHLGSPDT